MAWFAAPAITQLNREITARWPDRDTASDGVLGDGAHQPTSDHYPAYDEPSPFTGIVRATDRDVDGWPAREVRDFILARCRSGAERRLAYIINERSIWSATYGWSWRAYNGDNPHVLHQHYSLAHDMSNFDTSPWLAGFDGHGGEGGGTPIDLEEDDMPRYLKITGEPADPNTYGYTDGSWWVATAEEVSSFDATPRVVNARQRDVIRSRVLNNGKERAEAGLGDDNLAAIGAVVRREATDANARGLQTYLAGLPNAEFSPERVAEIKAEGARGGVLADLFPDVP